MNADKRVAHLTLDLGAWHKCRNRVDNDNVNAARTNQCFCDLERLLAGIWLAHQELVHVHACLCGVRRVKRVLNVNEGGDATAALIGSAIHALASLVHKEPGITIAEMESRLAANWKMIDQTKGWVKDYELRQTAKKLKKFFEWHAANARTLVGVEEKFELMIGRAKLTGSADRLEIDSDGQVYIVDLKSGGTSGESEKSVQDNLQLAGYQLAVARDGFIDNKPGTSPGGAQLLFLGGTEKSASSRTQFVVDVVATEEKIATMAEAMAASTFTATINARCRTCGVKNSCPLQSPGRSVIDEA